MRRILIVINLLCNIFTFVTWLRRGLSCTPAVENIFVKMTTVCQKIGTPMDSHTKNEVREYKKVLIKKRISSPRASMLEATESTTMTRRTRRVHCAMSHSPWWYSICLHKVHGGFHRVKGHARSVHQERICRSGCGSAYPSHLFRCLSLPDKIPHDMTAVVVYQIDCFVY